MHTVMARHSVVLRLVFAAVLLGCIGCNSMNGSMNNQVGITYYRQGNYSMARDEFQRAAANDPWNADYIGNAATAMKRQGDLVGAERTYRQALNVDPGHQTSNHGLALLMKEQGRTDEANSLLAGWINEQPYSAEPYIEAAWLKRETGDVAGTEQLLLQALRAKPNDYIATAQLGQLYQDTDQPERAAAMYQRSLHAKWNQPEVQSRLTQLQRPYASGASTAAVPRSPTPVAPFSVTAAPRSPTLNSQLGPQSALTPRGETAIPVGQPLPVGSTFNSSGENADPAHTMNSNEGDFVEPH